MGMHRTSGWSSGVRGLALAGLALGVVACSSGSNTSASSGTKSDAPANCAALINEPAVTREEINPGARSPSAKLMLRFVQLTDDHIIDDDGQSVIGASIIDPLNVQFESAMRFQEEYSDEVLNDLTGRINACNKDFTSEFSIVTGDSADLTTVGEIRRFIDNLDGTFDQVSGFETTCRASQPVGTPEALLVQTCTRFTGRGVADTQTPDPDPSNLLFQPFDDFIQQAYDVAALLLGES